jgi:hypothetical protein
MKFKTLFLQQVILPVSRLASSQFLFGCDFRLILFSKTEWFVRSIA